MNNLLTAYVRFIGDETHREEHIFAHNRYINVGVVRRFPHIHNPTETSESGGLWTKSSQCIAYAFSGMHCVKALYLFFCYHFFLHQLAYSVPLDVRPKSMVIDNILGTSG